LIAHCVIWLTQCDRQSPIRRRNEFGVLAADKKTFFSWGVGRRYIYFPPCLSRVPELICATNKLEAAGTGKELGN
jgi:hypothetical protein